MKTYIALVLALASSSSFALTPTNLYDCKGKGVSANYSTSSISGEPLLTITLSIKGGFKRYEAKGDEIQTQTTVLGNLVTLTKVSVPDAYTDTITLLIPDSNTDSTVALAVKTQLFQTRSYTSIGGTELVNGLIQSNKAVAMTCTASAVVF